MHAVRALSCVTEEISTKDAGFGHTHDNIRGLREKQLKISPSSRSRGSYVKKLMEYNIALAHTCEEEEEEG